MITARLEETKYTLVEVIQKRKASPTVVALFEKALNQIDKKLRAQGKPVYFVMNTYGVTGFCAGSKAFLFVDLKQNFVTMLFFTGDATIPGLAKANWITGTDEHGSERIRIADDAALKTAVDFACAAYDIAVHFVKI